MEKYNKASPNERIGMLKILRLTLEHNQLKRELQEASTSGAVSDETLAQLKRRSNELGRRWKELGRSTKRKTHRVHNASSALKNEGTHTTESSPGNNHSPLARALQKIAQRSVAQKKEKQEATGNRPWRNVPQYYAARKERLKHRPAKATNDDVRAYRQRLIQDLKSLPQPPATPMRQSTKRIRFKEGHETQAFDLGQPATAISKRVVGQAELTLTAAEKRFIHEDDWNLVSPHSRHSARATCPTAQQIREATQLASELQQPNARPSLESSTNLHQIAAVARRLAHESRQQKAALKRSEQARQRAREDERLDAALPAVLKARKEARTKKTAAKLLSEARRVVAQKKQKERWQQRRNRDFQQACYLKGKYGSLQAGFAAMDYVERPSKRNLTKFQARMADVAAEAAKKARQSLAAQEPLDLVAAVAKSWKQREPIPPDPPVQSTPNPSFILDTGYSGKNLVTAEAAAAAKLPRTGPSNTTIIDAHGNASRAEASTQVSRPGLPASAGAGVINSNARFSLAGGTNFADHGLLMIFHPGYGGVTMHRPEDVDIVYKAAPRVQGWREHTGERLWHIGLESPQPARPSTTDRLLRARSPEVTKRDLATLHEVAHNVYELPTLGQGIKWMHAVCGYPAKDTWIKAIRAGNFVGWPLLTVENVHRHYPETDETPMGRLDAERAGTRSTKKKFQSVPLPTASEEDLKPLLGKKNRDVYIKMVDTWEMKNIIYSDQTGKFPVKSRAGNRYITVMVEIDSNYILVEPMKNKTDDEMIATYQKLLK